MASPQADIDFDLAPLIDHSLLVPIATPQQVERYCDEAVRLQFAAVCISPIYVRLARQFLHGKKPKVCTTIGFPSGATTSATKLYEAREAVEHGAQELDVVLNLGWLKTGNTKDLFEEIACICEEAGQPVKAILEMSLLTEAEKRLACEICLDAGVSFLKTSTGYHGGATLEDVRLLREMAGEHVGIKASGGIRTREQAIALVQAGATRIGTSRGVDLVQPPTESEA